MCTYVCDVCCAVKVSIVVMSLFTEVLYNVSIFFFHIHHKQSHTNQISRAEGNCMCVMMTTDSLEPPYK